MHAVTRLAVHLDITMLHARGVVIADEDVPVDDLPFCTPTDHLGDRLLLKYLRPDDPERFSILSGVSQFPGRHYVTPTPIAREDLVSVLMLQPRKKKKPCWCLPLLPHMLYDVRGPRRINGGYGVEYILDSGFSSLAIAGPGWLMEYK